MFTSFNRSFADQNSWCWITFSCFLYCTLSFGRFFLFVFPWHCKFGLDLCVWISVCYLNFRFFFSKVSDRWLCDLTRFCNNSAEEKLAWLMYMLQQISWPLNISWWTCQSGRYHSTFISFSWLNSQCLIFMVKFDS